MMKSEELSAVSMRLAASLGALTAENMFNINRPGRKFGTHENVSWRPKHTKNIFVKWKEGEGHPCRQIVGKGSQRREKLVLVRTEAPVYDMKQLKKLKKLRSRKKNFKGKPAR